MCTPHEILRPKLVITRTQVLELGPQDLETSWILILVASSFHPHCILVDEDATDEDATNEGTTDEDATKRDATDEDATNEDARDEDITNEDATDEDNRMRIQQMRIQRMRMQRMIMQQMRMQRMSYIITEQLSLCILEGFLIERSLSVSL